MRERSYKIRDIGGWREVREERERKRKKTRRERMISLEIKSLVNSPGQRKTSPFPLQIS